jgi:hypothetical protein
MPFPQLVRALGITAHAKRAPLPKYLAENLRYGGTAWSVTLRRGPGRSLTTPFFQGPFYHDPPDAARVLSSLLSDASSAGMSFGEFCSEFGYDHDECVSQHTGRPLKRCRCRTTWGHIEKMARKVRAFLGADYEEALESAREF